MKKSANHDNKMISKNAKVRECLRCDKDFKSQGPQNRLCEECKETITKNQSLYDGDYYLNV